MIERNPTAQRSGCLLSEDQTHRFKGTQLMAMAVRTNQMSGHTFAMKSTFQELKVFTNSLGNY